MAEGKHYPAQIWRKVGSTTGTQSLALPGDDWTEFFAVVYFPLNENVCFYFNAPRAALNDTAAKGSWPVNGARGTDEQECSLVLTKTSVRIREYYRNQTNYTSSATMDVYVR